MSHALQRTDAKQAERQTLTMEIPDWVPSSVLSLNGRRRAHWTTIRAYQEQAKWKLSEALRVGIGWRGIPWAAGEFGQVPPLKARVSIDFVYPRRRRRDPDGLAGLCKPLLDTLVFEGVLLDDDSEHIELSVRAVVERGIMATRIKIEEME